MDSINCSSNSISESNTEKSFFKLLKLKIGDTLGLINNSSNISTQLQNQSLIESGSDSVSSDSSNSIKSNNDACATNDCKLTPDPELSRQLKEWRILPPLVTSKTNKHPLHNQILNIVDSNGEIKIEIQLLIWFLEPSWYL